MIKGIGIDIVDKSRISRVLDRQGAKFIDRILTGQEQQLLPEGERKIEFVAGRYAAKEAFAKATGYGIGKQLGWHDLEVLRDERGKPVLRVSEQWRSAAYPGERLRFHLSLSHEKKYAVAQVIIETDKNNPA